MTAGLVHAKLIQLADDLSGPLDKGATADVQFNPETLKITYANQIVQPKGGDQAAGTPGRQFVGEGTTKLALQLWFDVTAMETNPVDDVRRLTQPVIFFMTPQKNSTPKSADEKDKLVPPPVRFQWGSFIFDGVVDGIEQSLEFFSPDGKPLRASIGLTLSQQKILAQKLPDNGVASKPGQNPLTSARQGDTLQAMAGRAGIDSWQSVASANGIEDPLRMAPGALVDLGAALGTPTSPVSAVISPPAVVVRVNAGASLGGSVSIG
ncbi:hypothetical protein [Scleromatobacter humisilvae]|uniref:Contractile injection system tube protein N-terminal domain-containing protein n=1 Tax=Scleromatobacter humisilvae TaxID=2897159 RepID=A0A9X1YP40_9BURK|nr:hypothetical protein [Scleromatobacter humisilvae]MCK9688540.1 hypothetical protein [Scleromatobacter humisilvae]